MTPLLSSGLPPPQHSSEFALTSSILPHPGISVEQLRDRFDRATKIIATLGPKTSTEEKISELVQAGVNIFRLNFSHGTHEDHSALLAKIRAVAKHHRIIIGVVQDLCGPKTRIGILPHEEMEVKKGQEIVLVQGKGPFEPKDGLTVVSTELFNPPEVLKVGQKVFLADARFELAVKEVRENDVVLEVVRGGKLRSKVGIAVPDTELGLPAYSAKDLRDLEWGIQNRVDYVALSFVNTAEDVIGLREEMHKRGGDIPIIAKIERKGALTRLKEICKASDALMVARGDLGVDIPSWDVPEAQLNITAAAQADGKPVIVATQVLPSMVSTDQPARCEVSDVFNGARHGVDALMLSEETAVGDYPAQAVNVMSKTSLKGQRQFLNREFRKMIIGDNKFKCSPAETIAVAAAYASMGERYHAIIACTETGNTARLIAKHRPEVPVYGVSSKFSALRRMSLLWGVNPLVCKPSETAHEEKERAFKLVASRFFEVYPEQKSFGAIIVNGAQPGVPFSSSQMECREVTRAELAALREKGAVVQ